MAEESVGANVPVPFTTLQLFCSGKGDHVAGAAFACASADTFQKGNLMTFDNWLHN